MSFSSNSLVFEENLCVCIKSDENLFNSKFQIISIFVEIRISWIKSIEISLFKKLLLFLSKLLFNKILFNFFQKKIKFSKLFKNICIQ